MTGFGLPVDIVKCKISSSLTFGLGTFLKGIPTMELKLELVYSSHRGFLLFMTCLKDALPAAGGSVVTIAYGRMTEQSRLILERSVALRLSPQDTVCPTITWSILQDQFAGQKIANLKPQIFCANMGIYKASGAI